MQLIIDNREIKLKEFYKNKEYIKFLNLDIGDILFKYNDQIILIIERKTLPDLASSIKDGRFREQKYRLLSKFQKNKILYIIEGSFNRKSSDKIEGLNMNVIYGSLINLFLRDNINYHKTKNIKETCRFLNHLIQKFFNQGISFIQQQKNLDQLYNSNINIIKKKNLTPARCYKAQLVQIPGISSIIADNIIKYYPSLVTLFESYFKCGDDETKKINLIKNLTFQSSNGKSRKFGPKISQKLYIYLFNKDI